MLSTFFPFFSLFKGFLFFFFLKSLSFPLPCSFRVTDFLLYCYLILSICFHRTLVERCWVHSYPRLLDGFQQLLQLSNFIIAKQSRIYHSLFHPNNVPVKFLKSPGKLVVITCWSCDDCVYHVMDSERWLNGVCTDMHELRFMFQMYENIASIEWSAIFIKMSSLLSKLPFLFFFLTFCLFLIFYS